MVAEIDWLPEELQVAPVMLPLPLLEELLLDELLLEEVLLDELELLLLEPVFEYEQ